jgi:adenosylcobinamide-GDP ribazoletransferase
LGSWTFYTTLPAPAGAKPRFERIAPFAPVVGLVLGGLQGLVWQLGWGLGLPSGTLICLVLVLGLWLNGGLHLDGVIDSGDGLAAGDRRLEAMADSRIGASGLVAALLVLLLKAGALLALGPAAAKLLAWSAVWGRVAPLLAIARFPYLRQGGSGGFHRQAARGLLIDLQPSAAVLGLLAGITLALAPSGASLALLVAGVMGLLPTLAVPLELGRRLGGHTGDSYGASVEWTEALALWAAWITLRLAA